MAYRKSRSRGAYTRGLLGSASVVARSLYKGIKRGRSASRSGRKVRAKLSTKSPYSYTRTRTKSKRSISSPENLPAGVRSHAMTITLGYPKKLFKSTGNYKFVQQGASTASSNPGQQSVTTCIGHFTRSQFTTSTGNNATLQQFPSSFFALCPNQKISGSAVYSSATTPSAQRIHIRYAVCDFMVTNFSNAPIQVLLYWVKSKKGVTVAPDSDWSSQTTLEALGVSGGANASETTGAVTVGTAGYPSYAQYGQSPLVLKAWRQNWQCLRMKYYTLGAGETQRVKYKINLHKTFNYAQFNSQASDWGVAGSSIALMMVCRGTPVATNNAGGSIVSCTTGAIEVGYTASCEYNFTALEGQNDDTSYIHPNLIASVGGTDTVKLFNEVGSEIAAAIL